MVTLSEFADGRGFLITCPPQIDVRDFYEAKKALEERFPNLPSWYFGLVDMSLVSEMTVAAADFDLLLERDRKIAQFTQPGFSVAVIARAEIAFGMARMWQSSLDNVGWDIMVFRERPPAEAWIRQRVLATFSVQLPPFDLDAAVSAATAK